MAYNFKTADRETPYLMPPSLSEWLPEGHLAWFIVAEEVTQDRNDVERLHPMLEKVGEELADAGVEEEVENALADAGYWSQANDENADPAGPELFIATNKDWKQRKALRDAPPPRGRMRKDMTARDRMERKLLTKRGRALYKLRGQTVEPVFGQIKDARGFDRFMRRGLSAVVSEWSLICATHNLLKMWRAGRARIARVLGRLGVAAPTFAPVYV